MCIRCAAGACPDGHVLFSGLPKGSGQFRLFRMNGDGGDLAQMTTTGIARAPACSPDSQRAYLTLGAMPQYSSTESAVWGCRLRGELRRRSPPDRYGGHTLLYEPLDGSPSRQFLDPMSETISDFSWSPSGKQLALSLVKSSSDVVLITDQTGKGKN